MSQKHPRDRNRKSRDRGPRERGPDNHGPHPGGSRTAGGDAETADPTPETDSAAVPGPPPADPGTAEVADDTGSATDRTTGSAADADAGDRAAPDPAAGEPADGDQQAREPAGGPADRSLRAPLTRAVMLILLVLLGFTLTVQVRNVSEDPTVAALGQEDLVRILANLDAHEERLRQDIAELQETRRRLATAGENQQEALDEAQRRADELGVLAGTLPVEGPGVLVELTGDPAALSAARLLDAVQELRSAGAEAMQIEGAEGAPVRVVASTYLLDAEAGIVVDGRTLTGPYRLTVIGDPDTLAPALRIPGGVVESIERDGGTVILREQPGEVEVSAVREPAVLRHARPDS